MVVSVGAMVSVVISDVLKIIIKMWDYGIRM